MAVIIDLLDRPHGKSSTPDGQISSRLRILRTFSLGDNLANRLHLLADHTVSYYPNVHMILQPSALA